MFYLGTVRSVSEHARLSCVAPGSFAAAAFFATSIYLGVVSYMCDILVSLVPLSSLTTILFI